jgi:hypothetical protein
MRGNISFIIPSEKFELLGDSKEFLTDNIFLKFFILKKFKIIIF